MVVAAVACCSYSCSCSGIDISGIVVVVVVANAVVVINKRLFGAPAGAPIAPTSIRIFCPGTTKRCDFPLNADSNLFFVIYWFCNFPLNLYQPTTDKVEAKTIQN